MEDFIVDPEKIDLAKAHEPSFDINRNYIGSLIPDNLRETWVFQRVADIIYAVISDKTEIGNKIKKYYYDVEYFNSDFTKLTLEMKQAKLHDMGFDYLIEVFGSNEDQLNDLSAFLNLIKVLKGRKEGFKLILDTLGIVYKAQSWEDLDYKNEVFTYDIVISLSAEQSQLGPELIKTIQKIAREYLAPQVNITYTIVENLLSDDKFFIAKYSGNYDNRKKFNNVIEVTRSLK